MSDNMLSVDFSELNELNPFFEGQEKIMSNTVAASFVKGGAVMKKALGGNLPSGLQKFKGTLAVKKYRPQDGIIRVAVGFFGRRLKFVNARGKEWDAFFPLYWKNYGTLQNRDASHQFQYKVRPVSQKKSGGINPVLFFDHTAEANMESAYNTISESTEKELAKNVLKFGFK